MARTPVEIFARVLRLQRIAAAAQPVEHVDLLVDAALCIDQQDRDFGIEVGGPAKKQFDIGLADLCWAAGFALDHDANAVHEGYHVQVAAFSSQANAKSLAARIDGHVVPAGRYWRVELGPFADATAAQRARDGAVKRGYGDARVRKD